MLEFWNSAYRTLNLFFFPLLLLSLHLFIMYALQLKVLVGGKNMKLVFIFLLLYRLTMRTTAYRHFFTVYHTVKMPTRLGVLFTVFFLTRTVDNVTLLLVDAKNRWYSLWNDYCSVCIFIICDSRMYITFFRVKVKCFALTPESWCPNFLEINKMTVNYEESLIFQDNWSYGYQNEAYHEIKYKIPSSEISFLENRRATEIFSVVDELN